MIYEPINGALTLLGYLDWIGMDNGADYDDGADGYFSWRVEETVSGRPSGALTVTWRPYDRETGKPGEAVTEVYELLRVE